LLGVWTLYSLPLVYFGLRTTPRAALLSGLGVVCIAFVAAMMWGIEYHSIDEFSPVMNVRALALVIVLCGLYLHASWVKGSGASTETPNAALPILLVAQLLLLLALLTGEVRDIFLQRMSILRQLAGSSDPAGTGSALTALENMKQLSLSSLWLVYGIALMAAGIWRRVRLVRIAAIILFGIAILKIFIYDLSFLETLYRIFSFIGLGVILLTVSYLYQRYKSVIVGPSKAAG
jgi:uncharacterized membrane protein